MKLSGRPIEIEGNKITLMLDEPLNIEHIETMYNKPVKDVSFWVEAPDPRHATPAQRRFYFALIGDIFRHYGQPVSDLKDYFEIQFEMATGIEFSMSETSSTTVSESNFMNDMLIDFIMEHNIPFKKGFEILPQNMNRYLFGCIKYRQCAICREHAQIHHHENLVGMGRNRNKIDHSSSKMIALCWKHHDECHRIGLKNFANKYHLVAIKVDEKTMKRIGLRTVQKGNVIEVEEINDDIKNRR